MKTRSILRITALLFAVSVVGFGDEVEEYAAIMKAAAGANGMMQKSIENDLSAAAASAAAVKDKFHEIEEWWAMKDVADAQEFAKNIQKAADEVAEAASAGNKEQAMAAAKQVGANCGGCHQAHREKGADGKFVIK